MKRALIFLCLVLAACHAQPEAKAPEIVEPKTAPSLETFGVSETTKEMFKREGLALLQQRLNQRLSKVKEKLDDGMADAGGSALKNEPPDELEITAMLDEETQRALGAFQKSERLPETGMPDYETLARLGFKPSDVFFRRPPANRGRSAQGD